MELSLAAAGVLDARSTTREGAERHGEAAQRRCYLTSSSCQTYSASSPHQRDSDSVACEVYIWRRRPPAASPRGRAPMAWPPRLQGRGRHATSVACMATFLLVTPRRGCCLGASSRGRPCAARRIPARDGRLWRLPRDDRSPASPFPPCRPRTRRWLDLPLVRTDLARGVAGDGLEQGGGCGAEKSGEEERRSEKTWGVGFAKRASWMAGLNGSIKLGMGIQRPIKKIGDVAQWHARAFGWGYGDECLIWRAQWSVRC